MQNFLLTRKPLAGGCKRRICSNKNEEVAAKSVPKSALKLGFNKLCNKHVAAVVFEQRYDWGNVALSGCEDVEIVWGRDQHVSLGEEHCQSLSIVLSVRERSYSGAH